MKAFAFLFLTISLSLQANELKPLFHVGLGFSVPKKNAVNYGMGSPYEKCIKALGRGRGDMPTVKIVDGSIFFPVEGESGKGLGILKDDSYLFSPLTKKEKISEVKIGQYQYAIKDSSQGLDIFAREQLNLDFGPFAKMERGNVLDMEKDAQKMKEDSERSLYNAILVDLNNAMEDTIQDMRAKRAPSVRALGAMKACSQLVHDQGDKELAKEMKEVAVSVDSLMKERFKSYGSDKNVNTNVINSGSGSSR